MNTLALMIQGFRYKHAVILMCVLIFTQLNYWTFSDSIYSKHQHAGMFVIFCSECGLAFILAALGRKDT